MLFKINETGREKNKLNKLYVVLVMHRDHVKCSE